jgi:hypothetical protein
MPLHEESLADSLRLRSADAQFDRIAASSKTIEKLRKLYLSR